MKIKVDEEEIFVLSEIKKKVIENEIFSEQLNDDLIRRIKYIINHKYEQCFKRLKSEWEPKLKENGIKMFPSDDDQFAELVFSQKDYKNRSNRETQK